MHRYKPESWSAQARRMANTQLMWVQEGEKSVADAAQFFSKSYRAPLIRYRAAKRFHRLARKLHLK